MKLPKIIDRDTLVKYVCEKINYSIPCAKVYNIAEILFDEMISDFINRNEIRIINFGTLKLKICKTCSAQYLSERITAPVREYNSLKFKLSYRLRNKLRELVDLDKTFGDGYNFEPVKCKEKKGR